MPHSVVLRPYLLALYSGIIPCSARDARDWLQVGYMQIKSPTSSTIAPAPLISFLKQKQKENKRPPYPKVL